MGCPPHLACNHLLAMFDIFWLVEALPLSLLLSSNGIIVLCVCVCVCVCVVCLYPNVSFFKDTGHPEIKAHPTVV